MPDLDAPQPDWLMLGGALEDVEPGGSHLPGFSWHREATLRPDGGRVDEHLEAAQVFVARSPGWLVVLDLAGNPDGLGRHQRGFVLVRTPEIRRLLPSLFLDDAPALWARSWPNLQDAAIDVDQLDPCHDARPGYVIEFFRGRTGPQTSAEPC
ncbi:hypothetical protein PWY87_17400 [Kribbella solani]|uniref:hypothetical protein n=1 Tax=Kribbella solani TaxID=236067 RepID=UPI0029A0B0D3|nr:hypothetical protein [Kribbella solani]MDX2968601.1 hypothetical protein [Kribbella solani]MDX3003467.1 hypothetical protein [Kribbella solani]